MNLQDIHECFLCFFVVFVCFFLLLFSFFLWRFRRPRADMERSSQSDKQLFGPNTKKKNERRWKNPHNKIQKYRQRKWEAKNIDNLWIILNSTRFFAHILQSERPLNKQDKGIHIFCGNLVATVLN